MKKSLILLSSIAFLAMIFTGCPQQPEVPETKTEEEKKENTTTSSTEEKTSTNQNEDKKPDSSTTVTPGTTTPEDNTSTESQTATEKDFDVNNLEDWIIGNWDYTASCALKITAENQETFSDSGKFILCGKNDTDDFHMISFYTINDDPTKLMWEDEVLTIAVFKGFIPNGMVSMIASDISYGGTVSFEPSIEGTTTEGEIPNYKFEEKSLKVNAERNELTIKLKVPGKFSVTSTEGNTSNGGETTETTTTSDATLFIEVVAKKVSTEITCPNESCPNKTTTEEGTTVEGEEAGTPEEETPGETSPEEESPSTTE